MAAKKRDKSEKYLETYKSYRWKNPYNSHDHLLTARYFLILIFKDKLFYGYLDYKHLHHY